MCLVNEVAIVKAHELAHDVNEECQAYIHSTGKESAYTLLGAFWPQVSQIICLEVFWLCKCLL